MKKASKCISRSRMVLKFISLAFALCFFMCDPPKTQAQESIPRGIDIVQTLIQEINTLKTLHGRQVSEERIDGKMIFSETEIRINFKPFSIYLQAYNKDGSKGSEVLYVEGKNNGKALINTNGFPFINLNLDPLGSLMRSKRHNTILDAGGPLLANILEKAIAACRPSDYDLYFQLKGQKKINGVDCYELHVTSPQKMNVRYTIKPNETLREIAHKRGICEYKIVEMNANLSGFESAKAGMEITLPNYYAPLTKLYLDKATKMPMQIEVFDENGLFSRYTYVFLKVNIYLPENAFDSGNPNYGF